HTRWPRDWSSDVCSSDLHFTIVRGMAAIRCQKRIDAAFAKSKMTDLMPLSPRGRVAPGHIQRRLDARDARRDRIHVLRNRLHPRSEERRGGKEGRCRWWT